MRGEQAVRDAGLGREGALGRRGEVRVWAVGEGKRGGWVGRGKGGKWARRKGGCGLGCLRSGREWVLGFLFWVWAGFLFYYFFYFFSYF